MTHRYEPERHPQRARHPRQRDEGKPRTYRTELRCSDKRRFTDEVSAKAIGMVELEENCGNGRRLWVYPCWHCSGWHLTSKNAGERYLVPDPKNKNSDALGDRQAD